MYLRLITLVCVVSLSVVGCGDSFIDDVTDRDESRTSEASGSEPDPGRREVVEPDQAPVGVGDGEERPNDGKDTGHLDPDHPPADADSEDGRDRLDDEETEDDEERDHEDTGDLEADDGPAESETESAREDDIGAEDRARQDPVGDPNATLRIQAMGDSHLAYNDDQSTADQLGTVLTERGIENYVENNAVGGATLGCGEGGIGRADNCIPPQYAGGDWTHILLSGGGNDFLESQCGIDVDALIGPDLSSGMMVDLIRALRSAGPEIILVRYVEPLDPNGEAGGCRPIETLMNRYRDFAEQTAGVLFIDTRDAFRRDEPSFYADDVHTSVQGSRRLAEHIVSRLSL